MPRTSATPLPCTELLADEVVPAFYERDEAGAADALDRADARVAEDAGSDVLRQPDAGGVRRRSLPPRSRLPYLQV